MNLFKKLFSKNKTEYSVYTALGHKQISPTDKPHSTKGDKFIRININEFLEKYRLGASIDENLFCRLSNDMATGKEYSYITTTDLSNCERALFEHLKLFRTAELNNLGIEAEKEGRIADAIKIYEENIYNSSYPAHHSFYRLGVLYRKAKDKENEIRVLKRAIEVFGENSSYSTDLDNILNPKQPVYPTSASPYKNIDNSLGEQFEAAKRQFPEFDFYAKSEDSPRISIKNSSFLKIKNSFEKIESEAISYESKKRFDLAAPIYERLIAERSPFARHYDKLIAIYFKAKLRNDLIRVLESGIDILSDLRKRQLEYVSSLASKNNRLEFFLDRVSNNKKVTYYNGAFELYNPYTCIEKWKKRLLREQ